MNKDKYILWFKEISIEDVPIVGGKNASLGEMYRNLTKKGVSIPNGFAITADAYRYLLEKDKISQEIKSTLKDLDVNNLQQLSEKGSKIRKMIRTAEIPQDLEKQIIDAYYSLSKQEKTKELDVAVRSSATAEDLPDASFAGQQETYLNIRGPEELLDACRKCFASLFTNRAIAYRVEKKFDHTKVALSITVQKMVRSDLASSGVMFSIDTETGFRDAVVINGAYGLGENVVQGAVNPDEFMVFKPTLKQGKNAIISKRLGEKAIKMVYDTQGNKPVKNINVDINHRNQFCITDKDVITLAKWACIIEDYYSQKAGHYKPMDMEWAIDGVTKKVYIVQARPETVQSNKNLSQIETYSILEEKEAIVTGISIGQKIATGNASIIKDVKDINKFKKGDILITEMTDPDWVPIMKIASGIVTNKGGKTCFSGDTKILTDKGLLTFKEIYENRFKNLKTPSLNKKTLKIEWKTITDVMKKKDQLISVSCTQTNRATSNILKVTPDHKMINIRNSELVDTEIQDMLKNNESVLVTETIPQLSKIKKNPKEGYVLGALFTDGHVHLDNRHGCIFFIQKPTKEKKVFIDYFKESFKKVYNYDLKESEKKESSGMIRGKKVVGKANVYRCYIKDIAKKILKERESLISTILSSDKEYVYNFLAGVIDGDGTYSKGRISIYISKEDLYQAVIIAFLRLGISVQVTKNRSIKNIQVIEKLDVLNKYTKRVNCKDLRKTGYRFFNTKQLFSEKFNSEINNRKNKDLLVDVEYLKSILSKIKDVSLKKNIQKLIDSQLRQKRIKLNAKLGLKEVYNITVKDNHTYFVFTSDYTPIAVNNCHAAIIARELGIPCIVGTIDATLKIKDKSPITIDCSSGDYGFVYEGTLKFKKEIQDIKKIPSTKTKIMLNVGNPEQALEQSFLPSDGVGLAREEFIINSWIKIHPLALINYNKIKDKKVKEEIDKLTIGYSNKVDYFVDKLSQGIARIAAAFYPKKVILRTSDFKTDEYANLIGGKEYEPIESNPMLGWRGASRYYQGNYREGFALECKAIKKVREDMGLTNLEVMIPFCRTLDEAKKVIAELKKNGLEQGKNGLKVIGMCEIPSNVILAEEFLNIFDGFSIGSNDLTQLTLGLDRNSEIVASIYDERNPAVKELITNVVKIAKKKKKYIGICGQAPSDYPDFAEFLVSIGIDSMSLNPDTLIKTKILVANKEKSKK
ncbi:MAG: phosphoenolpyruvate synthase [Candidatus ainarchaeum sp.]|nr:phosphoenolpyruvate synthase [Candidatus ainarchaeum sp.]